MPGPATEKVKVRVLEHRAVTIEGRLVEAGQEVDVVAAEAKTLADGGYAERVDGRKRP